MPTFCQNINGFSFYLFDIEKYEKNCQEIENESENENKRNHKKKNK